MKSTAPLALALFGALGCNTLDRFDTKEGEAYCGSIVTEGFVRKGFDIDLRLRMTLDTANLSTVPGTLTTSDASSEACKGMPVLYSAPMRVSQELLHDQLSTFDFGTGRDHNFMAWVTSPCDGPMLAVVSLLRNDDVEVRLIKPYATPAVPGQDPPPAGFGLFQMKRQKGDCGF